MDPDDTERTVGTTSGGDTTKSEPDPTPRLELVTFAPRRDRFDIAEELGRGGMGKVVAATDRSLERQVAIKQVLSERSDTLRRFEREVRITAQLEHASIVPVHDVGTDEGGRPYYVMRRIEGEPLSDRIQKAKTARERLALIPNFLAVVDAAAYAHARGVIHRDIKPANILLGEYGETLLIDWGLARRLGEAATDDESIVVGTPEASAPGDDLTRAGHVYGTLSYMPPEQARGEKTLDARADVYALGATLFHLLSGRTPFEGQSAADRIAFAVLEEEARPTAEMDPDVPAELVAIVTKAMATVAANRYRDAGALAVDLRAFLAGQLVAAHDYTVRERVARFVRKHRIAVAIASIAVVALAVIGIVAIRQVVRSADAAEEARHLAVAQEHVANQRWEQALLDRVRTLADRDPTHALILLRQLPAGSPNRVRARDIAAKAAARGIARGSSVHDSKVSVLAHSPDDRQLASVGDGGMFALHDLATGALVRKHSFGANVSLLLWRGHTVLVNPGNKIVELDTRTGTTRVLVEQANATDLAPGSTPTTVYYFDNAKKAAFELDLATLQTRELANDLRAMASQGGTVLVRTNTALHLLVDGKTIVLHDKDSNMMVSLAVSPTGKRVAAATDSANVVEWDASGREVRRWAAPLMSLLTYNDRDELFGVSMTGLVVRLGSRVHELTRTKRSIAWTGWTRNGLAVLTEGGSLLLIDELGVREIPTATTDARGIATSPTSSTVAFGSWSGTVRWIDLTHVVPPPTTIAFTRVCSVTRDRIRVFGQEGDLIELDRATGTSTTLVQDPVFAMAAGCVGTFRDGRIIVAGAGESGRSVIVDILGKRLDQVSETRFYDFDEESDTAQFADGKRLAQLQGRTETTAFEMPSNVVLHDVNAKWAVALDEQRNLVRFDRATRTTIKTKLQTINYLAVSRTGDVWFGADRELWRWTGGAPELVHRFPKRVHVVVSDSDTTSIKLADFSLWVRTGDGTISQISRTGREFSLGRHVAVFSEGDGELLTVQLETGERVAHALPMILLAPDVAADGRTAVAKVSGRHLLIFENVVPRDPDALPAWIDSVTNAVLHPGTDAITWKN